MTDLIPRDAAIMRVWAAASTNYPDEKEFLNAIAAIREAALKEAVKSLRDWQENLIRHRYKETAITVGMSADIILALIGEKK